MGRTQHVPAHFGHVSPDPVDAPQHYPPYTWFTPRAAWRFDLPRGGLPSMGCLFAIFAGSFPRLATIFIWLARPTLFSNAFNDRWFLPILGIIFLPVTTLMYVIVWSSTGLTGG